MYMRTTLQVVLGLLEGEGGGTERHDGFELGDQIVGGGATGREDDRVQ